MKDAHMMKSHDVWVLEGADLVARVLAMARSETKLPSPAHSEGQLVCTQWKNHRP